jgi:hypothetical protein
MRKIIALLFLFFLTLGILSAQHLKKDGTPDMRYKENKASSSASTNSSSYAYPTATDAHLKKDGTPDKRYKENRSKGSTASYTASKTRKTTYNNYPAARDKNGKIKRSEAAKHEFMKQTGYPNGRPGYVVDHIIPLKKGGCDCPENMQWQTVEAAKEKDKWE